MITVQTRPPSPNPTLQARPLAHAIEFNPPIRHFSLATTKLLRNRIPVASAAGR